MKRRRPRRFDRSALLARAIAGGFAAVVSLGVFVPGNAFASHLPRLNSTHQSDGILDVSCPSWGNCTAVGFVHVDSGVSRGLIASQRSGRWTPSQSAPLPPNASGAPDVSIDAVSCAAANACSAVGFYNAVGANGAGLLLTESGGVWSSSQAVLPGDAAVNAYVAIRDIACPAVGDCSAIGTYKDQTGAYKLLILSQASGKWSNGVSVTLPPRSNAQPQSIACVTPQDCVAVGSYSDASGRQHGLLLTKRAASWALTNVPLPHNAIPKREVNVSSISCASVRHCAAVGSYVDKTSTAQGMFLRESPSGWTSVEAAFPSGALGARLSGGLSCASPGNCTAIGDYEDAARNTQGVAFSESRGSWSPGVEFSLPSGAATQPATQLQSIACPRRGYCSAVGSYNGSSGNPTFWPGGLLAKETAGRWKSDIEATLPRVSSGSVLFGRIVCTSVGNCVAVGQFNVDNAGTSAGLVLTETRGKWGVGTAVGPPAR